MTVLDFYFQHSNWKSNMFVLLNLFIDMSRILQHNMPREGWKFVYVKLILNMRVKNVLVLYIPWAFRETELFILRIFSAPEFCKYMHICHG